MRATVDASLEDARILAVDLDGTLLRSDLLYESFVSACTRNPATPLIAMGALLRGKVALKLRLAELSDIDAATLPYNDSVIAALREWRAGGGRTALVTASAQELAERVAEHLGLFDEVHGSSRAVGNLKGEVKAEFLARRLGERGFAYAGNSSADFPVWRRSAQALAVTGSANFFARVARSAPGAVRIEVPARPAMAVLRALRPHQWLKNLLVFVPALAGHRLDFETLLASVLAFVAFCLVASGSYVVNDLLDLRADRRHPSKRRRPFASGDVPIAWGLAIGPAALAGGLGLAAALNVPFFWLLSLYAVATLAYSLWMKRIVIVDICLLSALYALRIFGGAIMTGISISVWLLAFSIFFFLSLAAVKRQAELIGAAAQGEARANGRGYIPADIPLIGSLVIGSGMVSVLVIVLYASSPVVRMLYRSPEWLLGVAFVVLYWIARTAMITHRGEMHDDPVVFAASDRTSYACMAVILALLLAGTRF